MAPSMTFVSYYPSGKLRRRQFYSEPLENGRVLSQGSTFTYQDVLDQLLVYTPETASGGADEMTFTLTDGIYTDMGRLEFTMDVRRSEGPRMTVNRGLQLPAGETPSIQEQSAGWTRRQLHRDLDDWKPSRVEEQNLFASGCFILKVVSSRKYKSNCSKCYKKNSGVIRIQLGQTDFLLNTCFVYL